MSAALDIKRAQGRERVASELQKLSDRLGVLSDHAQWEARSPSVLASRIREVASDLRYLRRSYIAGEE